MNNMLTITYPSNLKLSDFKSEMQEIISEYSCPLCEGILIDAVIDPCGHSFCFSCSDILLKNYKSCPFSNKQLKNNLLIRNSVVNNILDKQIVYCSNKHLNCEWSGKLSTRKDHILFECQKAKISCRFNCGNFFERELLKKHEESCDLRMEQCQFCETLIKSFELKQHYENSCFNYPKKCSCGMSIPLSKMSDHLENLCEDKIITCPFSNIGCFFKDYRKSMKIHFVDKQEYHLNLLTKKIQHQEDIINNQNSIISKQSEQIDLLKLDLLNMNANFNKKIEDLFESIKIMNRNITKINDYSVVQQSNICENNYYKNDIISNDLNINEFSFLNISYDYKNKIESVFSLNDNYLTKIVENYGWYGVCFEIGEFSLNNDKVIINTKLIKSVNNCYMIGICFENIDNLIVGGFYKNTSIDSVMFFSYNGFIYKKGLVHKKRFENGKQINSLINENDILTMIVEFDKDKVEFKINGNFIDELCDLKLKERRDLLKICIDMVDNQDKIKFI
jgi:hypothetical protein